MSKTHMNELRELRGDCQTVVCFRPLLGGVGNCGKASTHAETSQITQTPSAIH